MTDTRDYSRIIERTTESGLFYAWAITLVVASTMGFINGWTRGAWWAMSALWAAFFFAIPVIEFALVHRAATCFRRREWGTGVGAIGAAMLAFLISVWSTFNTAAVNQDGKAQARLAANEQQEDGKAAVNRAADKVLKERQAVEALRFAASFRTEINGVTVTTPEAAQSLVDQLTAHRFYGLSENCTKPKGRQTTEHCRNLAAARAAIASANDAMTRREELKAAEKTLAKAEADLEAARQNRSAGPVVTSTQSPFVKKAAYYFNMAEEDANTIESGLPALGLQLLTMVLAVFIGVGVHRQSDEPQSTTGFSRGRESSAETAASAPPAYYMSRPTTQSVATLTINDLLATR